MPTILRYKNYRLFFFSRENAEPIHVHIEKDDKYILFYPFSPVNNTYHLEVGDSLLNMNDWIYQVNQINPIYTMVANRNQDIKSWLIYDNENLNLKLNLPKAIPGNQTQIKNYNFERTVNNNLINTRPKIIYHSL